VQFENILHSGSNFFGGLEYECSHAYFFVHRFILFLKKSRVVYMQLMMYIVELDRCNPVHNSIITYI
jgi:hypothetical protein